MKLKVNYYSDQHRYNVFQVSTQTLEQVDALKRWEDNPEIDFWDILARRPSTVRIMASPIAKNTFESFLKISKISYEIVITNVEDTLIAEREVMAVAQARIAKEKLAGGKATVDFDHFWTYAEIMEYLDELATTYPSIASVEVLGQTYEGRDIKAIKISLSGGVDGSRPVIVSDATIHAR